MNKGYKSTFLGLGMLALAVLCIFANLVVSGATKSNFSLEKPNSNSEFKEYGFKQSLVAINLKGNRLNEPSHVDSETFSDSSFLVSAAYSPITPYSLTQHNLHIKNCLINCRKSDLIFPFHYFW